MEIKILTYEEFKKNQEELLGKIECLIKTEFSKSTTAKKWIRAKELQNLTGWSLSTIQTYRINGTLSYSKVGGTVFYDLRHLMNLLEKNKNL